MASNSATTSSNNNNNNRNNNVYLLIIYVNIILYATCFQLQRPLEPFLVQKLINPVDGSGNNINNINGNAMDSKEEYARLQSFFSIVQTIGSLVTGYYLDSISIKVGFMISFFASGISYYLLSISTTMNILYLSKIPTIFQAGFLCAQLAISQCTTEGTDRMTALGRLTFSYTLGMIVGPAIGGWVGASGDYYFGAKLAVLGSFVSMVLTYFLPSLSNVTKEKVAEEQNTATTDSDKQKESSGISSIFGVIGKVWLLLSTKVITGVALSIASSAFPLILKDNFAFDEKAVGFAMSSLSVVNALANGLLLGPFVTFLGGKTHVIITVCLSSIILFFGVQALSVMQPLLSLIPGNGLYGYMLTTYVITIFQFILSPAITNESTSRVANHEKGTLLGLEHSLFAAARIVTPQVGVNMLNRGGISMVAGAAEGLFIGILVLWEAFKGGLTTPAIKKVEDNDHDNSAQERKCK